MKHRRMNVRNVTILFLALILILAACSGNTPKPADNTEPPPASQNNNTTDPTPEPTPEPEAPKDPVTLQFHTWCTCGTEKLMEAFTAKYPWITIEHNSIDSGAVINDIVAGEESDLVQLDNGLAQWMSGDLLVDLTPYIEKDETIQNANILPGFMESFRTGVDAATGKPKQYVLPFSDQPSFFLVNKDLLVKNGLDMPSVDWTWNELLELARAVTNPDANEWGTLDFGDQEAQMLAMANGNADNNRYLNADATKSLLDTPGVFGDLRWIQDLIHRWKVQPTNEQKTELGIPNGFDAFNQGNFLFMTGWSWEMDAYKSITAFEWDVLPAPKGKIRQAVSHGPGPMSITKASKHKEEAFMFLSFLFTPEAQKVMIDNGWAAFITDDDVVAYYDQTPAWEKTANGPATIRRITESCCLGADTKTVDLSPYVFNTLGRLPAHFQDGTDFSDVIPSVEAYNERIIGMRQDLGW